MSQDSASVLASIKSLVASGNAQALVDLEGHADKAVRKAVRKALHQLRSRGVDVPEAPRSAWRADDGLAAMRGDVEPTARIDVSNVPGATSFVLVDVGENGSLLCSFVLDAADRVVGCQLYGQTDGQRNRMLRQWERGATKRRVPIDWARARINWARQNTVARGLPVPAALNNMADRLGASPEQRPTTFLGSMLPDNQARAELDYDKALMLAECHRWPVLFAIEPFLERVGTEYAGAREHEPSDGAQPEAAAILSEGANPNDGLSDEQRVQTLRKAAAGDEAVRAVLRGPMANLLDDAAICQWEQAEDAVAKLLFDIARELRASDTPETHEWAVYLLRFQVSTVAVRMLRQQAQQEASASGGGSAQA